MHAPDVFRHQLLAAIPRLRRCARALLHDVSAADDLVQHTLERALAHWHQFDPQRDIVVWLIGIAHNAHRDEQRRAGRLSVLDPQALAEAQDTLPHATPAGPAWLQPPPATDPGLRLDLLGALHRLPAAQREPLLLVCVAQLSYAECAEVLQIPVGTVMSRLSRARSALRGWLDGGSSVMSAPPPAPAPAPVPALKRVV